MNLFVVVLGIILTFFSVAILSYVSIATMMGPWIAPTLVLLATIFAKFRLSKAHAEHAYKDLLLVQAIGAGGGVIAVGVGFTLPILFFLDAGIFNQLLKDPVYFCFWIGTICLVAGSLGIVWGRYLSHQLIDIANLPFPTSQITYQLAILPSKTRQIKQLLCGGGFTLVISLLRDGIGFFKSVIPNVIYCCNKQIAFPIWPTMWVIGFTSGAAIALPLFIGLLTQKLLGFLLNPQGYFLTQGYVVGLSMDAFVTAFCAGLIFSEMVLWAYKKLFFMRKRSWQAPSRTIGSITSAFKTYVQAQGIGVLLAMMAASALFCVFGLPVLAQMVYFVLLFLATYQICFMGGKIGLVPFGRFSTLILIPFLLFFNLSYLQLTLLCVFFSVCAATASDLIFDNKIGHLGSLNQRKLYIAQWIGLVAASVSIGIILYLLFTHLSLGSPEFFGQRGQSKALMIKTLDFNLYVVAIGLLYGIILKKCGITPLMTFGGIIMPIKITTGLLAGSLLSRYVPQERYISVCSGVLVSEVLWIMISIVAKLFF